MDRSRSARVLTVLGLALGLGGCAAAQPGRVEDNISLFYDDLRWARVQSAETAMSTQLRDGFAARHAGWGEAIQILDMDLGPIRINGLVATVRGRFEWTRINDVTVRESVLETRWRPGLTVWICEDERVISGDPTLLAPARPARPAAAPGGNAPAQAAPAAPARSARSVPSSGGEGADAR